MIGATYGLQVRRSFSRQAHTHSHLTAGDHFYRETRVHAYRLDGRVHPFVRAHLGAKYLVTETRCSYPVYSFFLPVYSFWCMDDFGWGNTRLVIGEGKDKKVIINDDEKLDESMIPLKKFSGKDCTT
jgi:hypothetical protein